MDNRVRRPIWPFFEGRIGELREMRFWSLVDMRGPDECWDWQGSRQSLGYGRFKMDPRHIGHSNRIAWALANRRDPGMMLVRHKCDRPCCCNPAHLELGTHKDNAADMIARGRQRFGNHAGVNNPRAVLTEEQIREIVEGFRNGDSNTSIARRMPVGHSLISRIRLGLSWREETEKLGWQPKAQFRRGQAEISRLSAHPDKVVEG